MNTVVIRRCLLNTDFKLDCSYLTTVYLKSNKNNQLNFNNTGASNLFTHFGCSIKHAYIQSPLQVSYLMFFYYEFGNH